MPADLGWSSRTLADRGRLCRTFPLFVALRCTPSVRRPRDFYQTAPWQVDALVDHLPELSGSVWCPCVGDGSLLRRLLECRPDLGPVVTNDLDPTRTADYHLDATRLESWQRMTAAHGRPDWIIDNPPFTVAIDIAVHAFEYARLGLVLMTRVSFPEGTHGRRSRRPQPTPRGPWLSTHPRQQQIVLERYSFTGDGAATRPQPNGWSGRKFRSRSPADTPRSVTNPSVPRPVLN
jgi:hypothetical protein